MAYSKRDCETHRLGYGSTSAPAINVKVRDFAPGLRESLIGEDGFPGEAMVDRALEFAWETAQECFWEDAQELARETFGKVRVYSEGRSGGWLVVLDIGHPSEWNAVMIQRWGAFQRKILATVKSYCDPEWSRDLIEANGWLAVDMGAVDAPRTEV